MTSDYDYGKAMMALNEMEFCLVSAGPFWMGSPDKDKLAYDVEKPLHQVNVPYNYWIGRYPVTNAQFKVFIHAGGYGEPGYWREAQAAGVWQAGRIEATIETTPRACPCDFGAPYNLPDHPVVGITWYEALAFTRWLSEQWLGDKVLPAAWVARLPSEAEWEKTARGGLEILAEPVIGRNWLQPATLQLQPNDQPQRRYPWGDKSDPSRANFSDAPIGVTSAGGIGATSAVGSFSSGASCYGAQDLSGNVWEWTQSVWGRRVFEPDFKYPYALEDGREKLEGGVEVRRVLRGGAFHEGQEFVRCAFRRAIGPVDGQSHFIGFRVLVAPRAPTSAVTM